MLKKSLIKILLLIILFVFLFNFVNNLMDFYNDVLNIDWYEELRDVPIEELEKLNIKDINNLTDEEIGVLEDKYIKPNLPILFIMAMGLSLVQTVITVFIRFFYIWIIVVSIVVSNKKVRKSKLSNVDFNKYRGYFRELLSEYSADVLSFIDDFKLDFPSDLIAMLMQLEHKKVIFF